MSEKVQKTDREWQEQLDVEQYHVCREGGTERQFTGKLWDCKKEGTYTCVCCGSELFSSAVKYESGSGWPSFWDVIDSDRIVTSEDLSHGMRRTEARCARCDAHLGHIFEDGPQPTGQRYCINSASLDLQEPPKE